MNKQNILQTIDSETLEHPLFRMALTHSSAASTHNERLEFLGDAVLGLCIADCLYQARPDSKEGELSRLRAHLVNRNTLAALGNEMELHNRIVVGPGESSGEHIQSSVLANTVEAILGALYLIWGYAATQSFIHELYRKRLQSLPNMESLKDPKSRLQEAIQKKSLPLPDYELVRITGKAHARHFRVSCRIEELAIHTTGEGNSRKAAEQMAAERALEQID